MEFLNYSIIHNLKVCASCGKNLNKIYRERILEKTSELLEINGFEKFNEDLLSYISEFTEHKYHNVIYISNSHMLSAHQKKKYNYPNGIWWNKKRFCSSCFKNGIIRSLLIHEKRLPYKIWHIGYFTSKNEIPNRKYYLSILDKISLPELFFISLFRTQQPINKNNEQLITEN